MASSYGSFQLLTVLGNGSKSISGHYRYSLAAYQSGSTLVLWDYVKDVRQNIPLLPNQWIHHIYFSKDGLTVLGLWLGQSGQPTLTVWRVADGEKIAEQVLCDSTSGGVVCSFHQDTNVMVVVQRGPVGFASIIHWDIRSLRHQKIAHGHIGNTESAITTHLLHDGRTFLILSEFEIRFYSFAEMTVRLLSRVLFKQSILQCEVFDDVIYLLSKKGKILCINADGQLLVTVSYPTVRFTSITIPRPNGNFLTLGAENGDVFVYTLAKLEFKCVIKCPQSVLLQSGGCDVNEVSVNHLEFGMNADYLFVTFANSSIGIAHVPSGNYVTLRVGHLQPLKGISLAPVLELAPVLASKLIDPDRHCISHALSFISLSRDNTFITWPTHGSPFRTTLYKLMFPHEFQNSDRIEAFRPGPELAVGGFVEQNENRNQQFSQNGNHLPAEQQVGEKLQVTSIAFRNTYNMVAMDGRLNSSYVLLVGANDGAMYLYEYLDNRPAPRIGGVHNINVGSTMGTVGKAGPTTFGWIVTLIRPPCREQREFANSIRPPAIVDPTYQGNVVGTADMITLAQEQEGALISEVIEEPNFKGDGLSKIGPLPIGSLQQKLQVEGINIPGVGINSRANYIEGGQYGGQYSAQQIGGSSSSTAPVYVDKQPPFCCHISFSKSGEHVITTYSNGFSEMLFFPKLHRMCILQNILSDTSIGNNYGGNTPWKCLFINHPDPGKRHYETHAGTLYCISQASSSELVLYEVYPYGKTVEFYAKTTLQNFIIKPPGEMRDHDIVLGGPGEYNHHGSNIINEKNRRIGVNDSMLNNIGLVSGGVTNNITNNLGAVSGVNSNNPFGPTLTAIGTKVGTLLDPKLRVKPSITDFIIHPSKLFLIVTAITPGYEQPQLYVWDIWKGRLLFQQTLFASALITSLAPLRPSVRCDISGTYVFCASTPAWIGSFDQASRDMKNAPVNSIVTDSVNVGTIQDIIIASVKSQNGVNPDGGTKTNSTSRKNDGSSILPPIASILCVIEFKSGNLMHQISLDIATLEIGGYATKIQDPTQLYVGSHDGSISIWAPPDAVRSGIKAHLRQASKDFAKQFVGLPNGLPEGSNESINLEEAVEAYWLQTQRFGILWPGSENGKGIAEDFTVDCGPYGGINLGKENQNGTQGTSKFPNNAQSYQGFNPKNVMGVGGGTLGAGGTSGAKRIANFGDVDDVVVAAREGRLNSPSSARDPFGTAVAGNEAGGRGGNAGGPSLLPKNVLVSPAHASTAGNGGAGRYGEVNLPIATNDPYYNDWNRRMAQGMVDEEGNSHLVLEAPELIPTFDPPISPSERNPRTKLRQQNPLVQNSNVVIGDTNILGSMYENEIVAAINAENPRNIEKRLRNVEFDICDEMYTEIDGFESKLKTGGIHSEKRGWIPFDQLPENVMASSKDNDLDSSNADDLSSKMGGQGTVVSSKMGVDDSRATGSKVPTGSRGTGSRT